jgi:chromosome segregation ATPase
MNKEIQKAERKVKKFQEQLARIREALSIVKNQIRSERANVPRNRGVLERRHQKAVARLERIQNKIDLRKETARKLKDNIKRMKSRHEKLPEDQKAENWVKLSRRAKRLGEEIIDCENVITSLELRKHAAEQAISMAEVSMTAFDRGLHEKPIREDPRLKEVLKERRKLAAKLKAARDNLRELQGKA